MLNVTKEGLESLLKTATATTQEQKDALDALTALCNEASENMILSDIAAYDQYILWNGEEDVRNSIDSGSFEDELSNMSEDELEDFIVDAAERIDWDYVDEACCEAGNSIVHQAICEELAARKQETQAKLGKIRIHQPDGVHSWGIEYNFEPERASDADATAFVETVNELKNARNMSGILFHQCGISRRSHEDGYKGYQFFEYWGPAPTVIVRRFAQDVANKLGCKVVSR